MKKVIAYIDGAASGNPGPAGIGVILCDAGGGVLKNISKYIGEATNNVAEYTAVIEALEACVSIKAEVVCVNTDSELLSKQLNRQYKVKNENLQTLYNGVLKLAKNFEDVRVFHIDRSKNKGADKLATSAIKARKKKAGNSASINLADQSGKKNKKLPDWSS